MTPTTRRILYVDPDPEARLLMQALLASENLDLADRDDEARLLARHHCYDIYIVAGGGPASSGLELCAWLHRVDPRTPIVFCSSNASAKHQQLALEAGALRYQLKPLDPQMLRSTLSLLVTLGQMESRRAMSAAQQAIVDELLARSKRKSEPAVAPKPQQALDCMLRVKAYRAFRDAGGNRANFQRLWPEAMDRALAAAAPVRDGRATPPLDPFSTPRRKQ